MNTSVDARGVAALGVLLLAALVVTMLAAVHSRLRLIAPPTVSEKGRFALEVGLNNALEAQIAAALGTRLGEASTRTTFVHNLRILSSGQTTVAVVEAHAETPEHALTAVRYLHFLRSQSAFSLPAWSRLRRHPEIGCQNWEVGGGTTYGGMRSLYSCLRIPLPLTHQGSIAGNLHLSEPLTLAPQLKEELMLAVAGEVRLESLEISTGTAAIVAVGDISIGTIVGQPGATVLLLLHSSRGSIEVGAAPGFTVCDTATVNSAQLRLEASGTVSLAGYAVSREQGCIYPRTAFYWPALEVIGPS